MDSINEPIVSVVLGTYNRLKYLKLTIRSIRREIFSLSAEIIVIDGGSTDGTIAWLAKQKDIITIVQHNRGVWIGRDIIRRSWGYFMNLGFRSAHGKYVCMLSDDCLVIPGAISRGIDCFEKHLASGDKIGAVAFYWRNWPKEKKYHVEFTINTINVNHGLYLKKALEDVDFIDEKAYMFYAADWDLVQRMVKKGYRTIDCVDAYVEHYGHATLVTRQKNNELREKDRNMYFERYGALIGSMSNDDAFKEIQKEYNDPSRTVRQFTALHLFNLQVQYNRFVELVRQVLMKMRSVNG